jgi:peptide/nickel transport system substrate-binding protein
LNEGDFEMYLTGFSWGLDPDQTAMWATDSYRGGFNMNRYSNPRVDELLRRGLEELDRGKRKQLYDQVMEILHEEVPYVYLFHSNLTTDFAMQPTVKGFEPYPDGILRLAGVSKQQVE